MTKLKHESNNFYGLAKVHKSNVISKVIPEQNSKYIQAMQVYANVKSLYTSKEVFE